MSPPPPPSLVWLWAEITGLVSWFQAGNRKRRRRTKRAKEQEAVNKLSLTTDVHEMDGRQS